MAEDLVSGRSWIAVENLLRATDGPLIERIERVARITGVPLVAAGDVHMHLRSRKPVLDVARRDQARKTVAECGFALASNAEQYLRPRCGWHAVRAGVAG